MAGAQLLGLLPTKALGRCGKLAYNRQWHLMRLSSRNGWCVDGEIVPSGGEVVKCGREVSSTGSGERHVRMKLEARALRGNGPDDGRGRVARSGAAW